MTANITLKNVNIDTSGAAYAPAIDLLGSAVANLTLSGKNTLKSGRPSAGIDSGNAGAGGTRTGSSFSTGSGTPFFAASSITDLSQKNAWKGVIFGGETNDLGTGKLYGVSSYTLGTDAEVPQAKLLRIDNAKTFIIASGTTLTNNGMIRFEKGGALKNEGVIYNYGTINGSVSGNQPLGSSNMSVSFAVAQTGGGYGSPTNAAGYGDKVKITAVVQTKKSADTPARATETMDFYLDRVDSNTHLGAGTVTTGTTTKTAVWEGALTGPSWMPSTEPHTIYVVYKDPVGSSSSIGTGALTVDKGNPAVPSMPEVSSVTDTSVTLKTIPGQMYFCSETTVQPSVTATGWRAASGSTLVFDGLKSRTNYYFWTYVPENAYYLSSSVSNPRATQTDVNADEKALVDAKTAIEAIASWNIPQQDANDQNTVYNVLKGRIDALGEVLSQGIRTTISICSFTAAVAGDADLPAGTAGAFEFTVLLAKGSSNIRTQTLRGAITPIAFTGVSNAERIALSDASVVLNIADGQIVITSTGYRQGSAASETKFVGNYILTGTSTDNTVTVQSGFHNITIDNLHIDKTEDVRGTAFALEGTAAIPPSTAAW